MTADPVKILNIIGSTRAGRFAPTVARWFESYLRQQEGLVVETLDLVEAPVPATLPAMNVPLGERDAALLAAVSPKLEDADAFVLITPEYNRSFPAALKNAIDWHATQWRAKPVGFVSYGGISGGLRAVEHLRLVLAELHAVTVRDSVSFANVWEKFGSNGAPIDPRAMHAAARLTNQLLWWARALRTARLGMPYVA
jgi:NAD(P)H-dependent FMN reductase